ncbi:MAG: hypothetical protein JWM59_2597 [Verrucomicrobiales bacterium]|nr:hypothetical protein [Verrucomicrobiales bacterium]
MIQEESYVTHDELLDYVKEFMRRAIATALKISRHELAGSMETQSAVTQCLTTVISIGYNNSLDAASEELHTMRSMLGQSASLADTQQHVHACYNTLREPIAGFERYHELSQRRMSPTAIWDWLRSRIHISMDYQDSWLSVADAWILRGERLKMAPDEPTLNFASCPPIP